MENMENNRIPALLFAGGIMDALFFDPHISSCRHLVISVRKEQRITDNSRHSPEIKIP
jgi:hypothetical protein